MNERIEKLAKQAYMWSVNEAKGDRNGCIVGSDYFLAMEKKKFAELIVRECAEVAWMNTPETEELEYSHLISNKIKEYFGVE